MSDTKKKILVVEDEENMRNLYCRILEDAGYDVESAEDGTKAYAKMKVSPYNLVLLDIMMPEMDGIQVLEKLIRDGRKLETDSTPVVLLTNLGQDSLVAKGLSLGIRGYLLKSDYTPDQLLREIQGYIK